jgi:hypothetical protein
MPPWRVLVPQVAAEIAQFTSMHLVAVQTVLVESYWNELLSGFNRLGTQVVHVLLECEEHALRHRIENDDVEAAAAGWRLDHIADYLSARDWLRTSADVVVDVTAMPPAEVAVALSRALG